MQRNDFTNMTPNDIHTYLQNNDIQNLKKVTEAALNKSGMFLQLLDYCIQENTMDAFRFLLSINHPDKQKTMMMILMSALNKSYPFGDTHGRTAEIIVRYPPVTN
jgi:hypothetical protein